MRVVQYNIYFGNHKGVTLYDRLDNLIECVKNTDADVLCFQEVIKESYNYLQIHLRDIYPYLFPHIDDGLTHSYETVIFSRYPMKKTLKHKYEFTMMGRDVKLVLIEDEKKQKVYICTTHFESEFKDACSSKIYQYKRCSDILQQLYQTTKIPVILCTDTNICNTTEDTFTNSFSYKNGWRDIWIENGSPVDKKITFDASTNPILIDRYDAISRLRYSSRLDRILHLSNLHSVNIKLIGNDNKKVISDHYGLLCDFTPVKPVDRGEYIEPAERKKEKLPYTRKITNYKKMF